MNRATSVLVAAMAFVGVLLAASSVRAQDVSCPAVPTRLTYDRTGQEGASPSQDFEIGVRLGIWLTDLRFEAATATENVELDEVGSAAAQIFGRVKLNELWGIEVDVESLLSPHVTGFTGVISGLYHLGLFQETLDTYVRAGIVFGNLEIDDVSGDFDLAVGAQGGIGADYALAPSLFLNVEVNLRYLKYEFDEDANVVEWDDAVGGFGVGLFAGIAYRF